MGFNEFKKLYDEYQKNLEREGRAALLSEVKALFAKFPEIEKIGWLGYTPAYCDGDACIFAIKTFGVKTVDPQAKEKAAKAAAIALAESELNRLKGLRVNPPKPPEDNDDSRMYDWYSDTDNKELKDAVWAFERSLGEMKDVVKSVFGDGHQVIIHNDNEMSMTVTEYEDNNY